MGGAKSFWNENKDHVWTCEEKDESQIKLMGAPRKTKGGEAVVVIIVGTFSQYIHIYIIPIVAKKIL